jgi:hypothetical protein
VIDRAQIPHFRFPDNCQYLHEDFCAWLNLIEQGYVGHRLPLDLGRYRLSAKSRSANKFHAAAETWKIYRKASHLPPMRAAVWWTQYAWNGFWMHRAARPR